MFATNDKIEIEASQFLAVARVRNVEGDKLHLVIERGNYLPWIDDPVLVRHAGAAPSTSVDARILHSGGETALIELLGVQESKSDQSLPIIRYDRTDEV